MYHICIILNLMDFMSNYVSYLYYFQLDELDVVMFCSLVIEPTENMLNLIKFDLIELTFTFTALLN